MMHIVKMTLLITKKREETKRPIHQRAGGTILKEKKTKRETRKNTENTRHCKARDG